MMSRPPRSLTSNVGPTWDPSSKTVLWLSTERWWTSCWLDIQSILILLPFLVSWPGLGMGRGSFRAAISALYWSTLREFCYSCLDVCVPSLFFFIFRVLPWVCWVFLLNYQNSFKWEPWGRPSSPWFPYLRTSILLALEGQKIFVAEQRKVCLQNVFAGCLEEGIAFLNLIEIMGIVSSLL